MRQECVKFPDCINQGARYRAMARQEASQRLTVTDVFTLLPAASVATAVMV